MKGISRWKQLKSTHPVLNIVARKRGSTPNKLTRRLPREPHNRGVEDEFVIERIVDNARHAVDHSHLHRTRWLGYPLESNT